MTHRERFGTIVHDAIVAMDNDATDNNTTIVFSPTSVAKRAGVSRATAKKYLEELHAMNKVVSCLVGQRTGYMLITE